MTSPCHGDRPRTIGFADSELKKWSGARDLTPGPHGPELCAVSSTEAVFEGFEFISRPPTVSWTRFGACSRLGLLHELLHEPFKSRPSGTRISRHVIDLSCTGWVTALRPSQTGQT